MWRSAHSAQDDWRSAPSPRDFRGGLVARGKCPLVAVREKDPTRSVLLRGLRHAMAPRKIRRSKTSSQVGTAHFRLNTCTNCGTAGMTKNAEQVRAIGSEHGSSTEVVPQTTPTTKQSIIEAWLRRSLGNVMNRANRRLKNAAQHARSCS